MSVFTVYCLNSRDCLFSEPDRLCTLVESRLDLLQFPVVSGVLSSPQILVRLLLGRRQGLPLRTQRLHDIGSLAVTIAYVRSDILGKGRRWHPGNAIICDPGGMNLDAKVDNETTTGTVCCVGLGRSETFDPLLVFGNIIDVVLPSLVLKKLLFGSKKKISLWGALQSKCHA